MLHRYLNGRCYRCEQCDVEYKSRSSMYRHRRLSRHFVKPKLIKMKKVKDIQEYFMNESIDD